MMKECIRVLKCLVKACEDLLEGMQTQGLDRDGYGTDMDEAKIFIAQAHKLLYHQEELSNVQSDLVEKGFVSKMPCYLGKLTLDDLDRLRRSFSQCWDGLTYNPAPVDELLSEFREKYSD